VKNSLQLLKVLHGELDACSKYLNIQKEKTDALVIGDIKKLDLIVRDEQSFVMKMESFENKRDHILMDSKLNNVTISEIIASYVEDDLKQQYQEVFDKLYFVTEDLKRLNALNQRLLKQRLSVVNTILRGSNNTQVITNFDDNDSTKFNKDNLNRA